MPWKEEKTKTNYGFKREGKSPFIIVAPHGAGDDLKTGILASKLARKLRGFLVVNNKYIKPDNKRAKEFPGQVEDFNNLLWGYSYNKYLWRRKHSDMKLFFQDIDEFCKKAYQYSKEGKAVVVYIHGVYSDRVGIDIGIGAKRAKDGNKIFGSRRHKKVGQNTGVITLKISKTKKIKKELEKKLKKEYNLLVTIGENYSGWSKTSAIQFHKHEGRDDYALQLEINHLLRQNKEKRDNLVNLLASVLKNNFVL